MFSCPAVVDPSGSEQSFFVNSSANIGGGGDDDENGLMMMMVMDIMMTVMMIINRFDSFSLLILVNGRRGVLSARPALFRYFLLTSGALNSN